MIGLKSHIVHDVAFASRVASSQDQRHFAKCHRLAHLDTSSRQPAEGRKDSSALIQTEASPASEGSRDLDFSRFLGAGGGGGARQ